MRRLVAGAGLLAVLVGGPVAAAAADETVRPPSPRVGVAVPIGPIGPIGPSGVGGHDRPDGWLKYICLQFPRLCQ